MLLCHLLLNYSAAVERPKQVVRAERKLSHTTSSAVVEKTGEGPEIGLELEKKKALLLLYCLIQFRNFKANEFNVLYLAVADAVRVTWESEFTFVCAMNEVMDTLKNNMRSGTE